MVIFLLVAIVLLLCTPQPQRGRVLAGFAAIGLLAWVLIVSELPATILGLSAVSAAFLWKHRAGTTIALGIGFFAFLISYFVYCGLADYFDNRALRREWRDSGGKIRTKFNKRVEDLMSLGFDRPKAEQAAMRVAAGD